MCEELAKLGVEHSLPAAREDADYEDIVQLSRQLMKVSHCDLRGGRSQILSASLFKSSCYMLYDLETVIES